MKDGNPVVSPETIVLIRINLHIIEAYGGTTPNQNFNRKSASINIGNVTRKIINIVYFVTYADKVTDCPILPLL